MAKRKLIGFGYDPAETTQRFVVSHPKRHEAHAIYIEHCINEDRRMVARLSYNQMKLPTVSVLMTQVSHNWKIFSIESLFSF